MNSNQTKSLFLLLWSDMKTSLKHSGWDDDFISSLKTDFDIYKEDIPWEIMEPVHRHILRRAWKDAFIFTGPEICEELGLPEDGHNIWLGNRIAFCLNKVFHIKTNFETLAENYRQIIMQQEEFESLDFEPAVGVLKSTGRKRLNVQSRENIGILSEAFRNALSTHCHLNKFILDNIPFEDTILSKTDNEQKIKTQFKKILKKEIHFYLDQLPVNQSQKEWLLGYLFASIGLSRWFDVFSKWQNEKNGIEASRDDWYNYLRTEGHNA